MSLPCLLHQDHCARTTTTTSAANTSHTSTQAHYQAHTADSYEAAYFYQPGPYLEALKDRVVDILNISPDSGGRLLDIGGGTGNFTSQCIRPCNNWEAVIVDPFLEANPTEKKDRIQFISAAAEIFTTTTHSNNNVSDDDDSSSSQSPPLEDWQTNYDAILLKEVVHHLDDRVAIFRGLHRALKDTSKTTTPQLLLVTRPQWNIDYPLWPAACKVWAANQPSEALLCDELCQAGFTRVETHQHITQCTIKLQQWQTMVKQRCWSTFGHFSDDELQDACDHYLAKAPQLDDNGDTLQFEDRLLLLAAYR
jgi:hypothetical protein